MSSTIRIAPNGSVRVNGTPVGQCDTRDLVAARADIMTGGHEAHAAAAALPAIVAELATRGYRSDDPCDCSEEYGPCERHAIIHAQREGASQRTADELTLCLVGDLVAIHEATDGRFGAELSPWGAEVVERCAAWLDGSMDHRWLDDEHDDDLADSLRDVAFQCENGSGLWITHDDGYVIAQVIGGPLFD